MVVRWTPPPTFPLALPGMNMAVVLSPESAVGPNVRDVNGDLVNEKSESIGAQQRYLCATVLPGFMADSYELSMWRHVVVDIDQIEAEVLLEYDAATRYYYMTV
ncbi:hypothetical protein CTA1_748 [Colletotrichum tanaceti]|uniref:Uncharacterized protein n=1 Tax=Colletotrichum tanaceti TaxID=1306861 RepID=A0A4U6XQU7_9PEZI|nr:hypothetical protein CTA1_748 [Colletotrichum tanaceti]